MDRRALLTLVGCGAGVAATGRRTARAACASDAAPPAWVFPAGDYRIGIDSTGDGLARLIVFASDAEPERSYTLPALPLDRRIGAWSPFANPGPAAVTNEAIPPPAEGTDAEVRLVLDPRPGVTTYVECSGIGVDGKAFVAATVLETGPTYLVRLDPATGELAAAVIAREARSVLAIYRRAGQDTIRVATSDGAEIEVRGS